MVDEQYPEPAALEVRLIGVVKRCSAALFSTALRRSLSGRLTPQQIFALAHISHHERTQPSDLAREQHVGMSAMTGLIDGLVARGLVERRSDPDDRRAVRLAITDAGQALLAEAQAAIRETARHLVAPLTPEQRERLDAALGDLERALDRPVEPAGTSGDGAVANGHRQAATADEHWR